MSQEENKSQPTEGLLKGMFAGLPLGSLGVTPQLTQREIVIEMTEAQFAQLALERTPPEARNAISIKFENGKMVIKIKLW